MSKGLIQHQPLRGIALMVIACLVFPIGDTIAKHLVSTHSVALVVCLKFFVQTLLVSLVIIFSRSAHLFKTRHLRLQLARGVAGIGSYATFVFAISYIPLADAIAIEFSSPMLVVALSVPLLGERVGRRRWLAVMAGFVGTMLIIRPGFGLMHWAASLMLLAAMFVALMQIFSRLLADKEHPLTSLFYLSLTGLVIASPGWFMTDTKAMSTLPWGLMFAVGAIAVVCHFLFVKAYIYASASLLAPFMYAQIVGATILGFFVFGDVPDGWTIVGTIVLIVSGLFIAARERLSAA